MLFKKLIFLFFFVILITNPLFSQKDSTLVKNKKTFKKTDFSTITYNPLSPAKAAFYSAIFPGMGQVYNKKYWKAPIAWAMVSAPTYFFYTNNKEYNRYRTAYKLRKNGLQDEFTEDSGNVLVSLETLERAQKQLRENRDLSLLWGVILYVVQIVEASVNAHLIQFNTDNNLSVTPTLIQNNLNFTQPKVGFTLKYNF